MVTKTQENRRLETLKRNIKREVDEFLRGAKEINYSDLVVGFPATVTEVRGLRNSLEISVDSEDKIGKTVKKVLFPEGILPIKRGNTIQVYVVKGSSPLIPPFVEGLPPQEFVEGLPPQELYYGRNLEREETAVQIELWENGEIVATYGEIKDRKVYYNEKGRIPTIEPSLAKKF